MTPHRPRTALAPIQRAAASDPAAAPIAVFHHAPVAMILACMQGHVRDANPAACGWLGFHRSELRGLNMTALVDPRDREAYTAALSRPVCKDVPSFDHELRCTHRDGAVLWARHLGSLGALASREIIVIHQLLDIREQRQREEHHRWRGAHDTLTGCVNRHELWARLSDAPGQLGTATTGLVFYLDIDGFKSVNDLLGHPVGDRVLQITAQRIQGALRQGDILGRVGGDEFVIVAPSVRDAAEGRVLAQRVLALLRESILVAGHTIHITASIGGVLANGSDVGELLKGADAALYAAKRAGKNGFFISG